MKQETLSDNEKIELARQSGYNEACYIQDKKFRGFIQNDVIGLIDKKIKNYRTMYGVKKETVIQSAFIFELEALKKDIIKEAGDKLTNHSPQPRIPQNRGGELKPISVCAEVDNGSPEDTQTLCECGHYHNAIYEEGKRGKLKFTDCSFCPCKKFKPKKKGCGEDYIGEEGEDLSCGECGLCHVCSAGCKMRPWKDGEFDGWVKEKFKKGDEK